jgi:hypothetical protein
MLYHLAVTMRIAKTVVMGILTLCLVISAALLFA